MPTRQEPGSQIAVSPIARPPLIVDAVDASYEDSAASNNYQDDPSAVTRHDGNSDAPSEMLAIELMQANVDSILATEEMLADSSPGRTTDKLLTLLARQRQKFADSVDRYPDVHKHHFSTWTGAG